VGGGAMHSYLIRHVADPLVDKITGRYTICAYKELMKTQWLSAEELIKYQEKKLRKLIKCAYENVPYYHSLFRRNNLKPDEIKTVEDLKKIPVSDKESLKRDKTYPNNLFAKNLSSKKVKFGNTGGTTGNPLILARDVNERSYTWAAYWRWLSWMNLKRGDKTATIWGQPIIDNWRYKRMINSILSFINNEIRLNSFNLTGDIMGSFTKKVIKYKPKRIHGYASSLSAFAKYVEENGIELPSMVVSTTAEVLEPIWRQRFEEIFKNQVFDQYGCGECCSLAFECDAHEGLHITSEHVIIESLMDGERNYGENEGEVVLTNLDNYFMPFIRYKNGDVIKTSDDLCSCGRNLPLIKRIGGRIGDVLVTPAGKFLHLDYFTDLLNQIKWNNKYDIRKYQLVQEAKDKIIWTIVAKSIPSEKEIEKLLLVVEKDFLGVELKINFVEDIACEPSGKYRYVKSNLTL
jgi:phenylacetate-CoA ligase